MKIINASLKNENTSLIGYIHDQSQEMANVDIRPTVLIFPGGGYFFCSDREADPVALAYLAEGYNAFILRYSVGAENPAEKALEDANEAIAYLHQHADELNLDQNKIVVIGFSAGGHLAAWLSVSGEIKPAATLLGYPCILPEIGEMLGKKLPDLCSAVNESTPPTFIFSTRDDAIVPISHSLQYINALDAAGVDFEVHIFGEGTHGLSIGKTHTSSGHENMVNDHYANWLALSVKWLKNTLGDFSVGE